MPFPRTFVKNKHTISDRPGIVCQFCFQCRQPIQHSANDYIQSCFCIQMSIFLQIFSLNNTCWMHTNKIIILAIISCQLIFILHPLLIVFLSFIELLYIFKIQNFQFLNTKVQFYTSVFRDFFTLYINKILTANQNMAVNLSLLSLFKQIKKKNNTKHFFYSLKIVTRQSDDKIM